MRRSGRLSSGTAVSGAGDLLAGLASAQLAGEDFLVGLETTASYVHLSIEQLAAEYGAARATLAAGSR
jgi:integrase/recombinase XerC